MMFTRGNTIQQGSYNIRKYFYLWQRLRDQFKANYGAYVTLNIKKVVMYLILTSYKLR